MTNLLYYKYGCYYIYVPAVFSEMNSFMDFESELRSQSSSTPNYFP